MLLPKLQENLILQNIGNEYVGYKADKAKAFCLNPTCAQVAGFCQEGLTAQVAIERLASTLSVDTEQAEVLLQESLDALQAEGLLQESEQDVTVFTRRKLLKVGTMAAMAPVIASVLVPTPAAATSLPVNPLCTAGPQTVAFVTPGPPGITIPTVTCGNSEAQVCVTITGANGGGGGGGGNSSSATPGSAGSGGFFGETDTQCQVLQVGGTITFIQGQGGRAGQAGQEANIATPGVPGAGGGVSVGNPGGAAGSTGSPGAPDGGGGGGGGGAGGTSTAISSETGTIATGDGGAGGTGGTGGLVGTTGGPGGPGGPGFTGSGQVAAPFPAAGGGGPASTNGATGTNGSATYTFSPAP